MPRVGLSITEDCYPTDADGFARLAWYVEGFRALGAEVQTLRIARWGNAKPEDAAGLDAFVDYQGLLDCVGDGSVAYLSVGRGEGAKRAADSVSHLTPFSFDIPLARSFLITIGASDDLGMGEVEEIVTKLRNCVSVTDKVLWSLVYSPALEGEVRTSVLVSGGLP